MESLVGEKRNQTIDLSIMLSLALIVLIVYARSFGSDLVFDNHFIIKNDTRLREFSARSMVDIFSQNYWWPTMYSNAYRPISTLAFNIQYSVLGFTDHPAGYQLINLILHITASILSYRILLRLHTPRWAAFSACLWFSIHPYTTEVVPNIVGLSDLLAYLSIVIGFGLYLDIIEGRKKFMSGGAQLAMCATLGVLSKENAVSLVALIIWHGATLGKSATTNVFILGHGLHTRRMIATASALLLLASATVIPKIIHQDREITTLDPVISDNPLRGETPLVARANALAILGDNMLNCLVPRTISADYSYGQIPLATFQHWDALDARVLVTAILVLCFGLSGLLLIRVNPRYCFAVGTCFIMALPTANIILLIGTIRADRLVYPLILPLSICAGLLAYELWRKIAPKYSPIFIKKFGQTATICIAVYFLMVATVTSLRATDWRTTKGFWNAAYATSPNSFKTKLGLAGSRDSTTTEALNDDIQKMRDSIAQLEASRHQAVRTNEGAWEFLANRLITRARHFLDLSDKASAERDLKEAEEWWMRVINHKIERNNLYHQKFALDPEKLRESRAKMDSNLASLSEIHRYFGNYNGAVALLREHYEDNKLAKPYLSALGRAEAEAGNWKEGAKQLLKVVLLQPDDVASSRETAWLIAHQTLPATSQAMNTSKRSGDASSPLLNILDPSLDQLGKEAVTELLADLHQDNRPTEARLLARQIRAILGRSDWLPDHAIVP